jgi:hypothetical protein
MIKGKQIKVHLDTLDRLEKYRTHPRETLDDLINNVLNQVELYKSEDNNAKETTVR